MALNFHQKLSQSLLIQTLLDDHDIVLKVNYLLLQQPQMVA